MHLHARLRPVWGQRNHLCISGRQLFNTITHRRPALLRGLPRVTHTSGISFQEHHCKVVLLTFRATLDIRRLFFTYHQPSAKFRHRSTRTWNRPNLVIRGHASWNWTIDKPCILESGVECVLHSLAPCVTHCCLQTVQYSCLHSRRR